MDWMLWISFGAGMFLVGYIGYTLDKLRHRIEKLERIISEYEAQR